MDPRGRFARAVRFGTLAAFVASGCAPDEALERPEWLDAPTADWPDLVLTSDLVFADTTYRGIGNAFFVALGSDTLAATVKHLFVYLADVEGLTTFDLGPRFDRWTLRSSRNPGWEPADVELLNADTDEPIGDFQALKDRDWLVLAAGPRPESGYVFRPRADPVDPGEAVFAVGRSQAERAAPHPTIWTSRVFRRAGHHFYVQPDRPDADVAGSSGSPVIDRAGRLVGIVSGASGRLGVVTGVSYLTEWYEHWKAIPPSR